MSLNRQTRRIIIAGQQNTGKSTFSRDVIVKNVPLSRQYVIEPDRMNPLWQEFEVSDPYTDINTEGKKRFIYDDEDKNFLKQIGKARNSLLIFDDCALMLNNPYRVGEFCRIFARARQSGNFIVFVIHSLSAVPKHVWYYATDIVMFKMRDVPEQGAYKIPEFDRVENMYKKVMQSSEPRAFGWVNLV